MRLSVLLLFVAHIALCSRIVSVDGAAGVRQYGNAAQAPVSDGLADSDTSPLINSFTWAETVAAPSAQALYDPHNGPDHIDQLSSSEEEDSEVVQQHVCGRGTLTVTVVITIISFLHFMSMVVRGATADLTAASDLHYAYRAADVLGNVLSLSALLALYLLHHHQNQRARLAHPSQTV
jgi:hypothetical protein